MRVLQATKGVELVAVADPDEAKTRHVCQERAIPHGCSTLAELLAVPLDFVVIATPLPLHVSQVVEALAQGVHVLSEVPAVATREECDVLLEAVERSGRCYMLAENYCYLTVIDLVTQLAARGEFGTIFYAEAEYVSNQPTQWRDEAGRPTWRTSMQPITYLTHSLGPIMWVTGQYPVEVACYGTGDHFVPGYTDLQVALFRMTDGSVARVTVSFANTHWGGFRYAFMGTRGSLDTGWLGKDPVEFYSPQIPHVRAPLHLPISFTFLGKGQPASLTGHGSVAWEMVQDFLQAIRAGTPPPIGVYDAIMYSLPGICAVEAARRGQPVAIPQYQTRRPGHRR